MSKDSKTGNTETRKRISHRRNTTYIDFESVLQKTSETLASDIKPEEDPEVVKPIVPSETITLIELKSESFKNPEFDTTTTKYVETSKLSDKDNLEVSQSDLSPTQTRTWEQRITTQTNIQPVSILKKTPSKSHTDDHIKHISWASDVIDNEGKSSARWMK